MSWKFVLAVTTAMTLLLSDLAFSQTSVAERLAPNQPPAVHANCKSAYPGHPEQSLAGFKWAIDRGVDVVTVGVQKTADDKYIVMKDPSFSRTTNVREVYPNGPPSREHGDKAAAWQLVSDYTLEEISKIRLRDPIGGDHSVPTLEEVLDLIDGRMLAVLRLDIYDADSLATLLKARDAKNLLLFTYEDKVILRDLLDATGIGAWDNLRNARDPMATLEKFFDMYGSTLKVVDVTATQLTPELVARAEELGVRLCLVSSVEDVALAGGDTAPWLDSLRNEVGIFTTKYPDAVLGLLGR